MDDVALLGKKVGAGIRFQILAFEDSLFAENLGIELFGSDYLPTARLLDDLIAGLVAQLVVLRFVLPLALELPNVSKLKLGSRRDHLQRLLGILDSGKLNDHAVLALRVDDRLC